MQQLLFMERIRFLPIMIFITSFGKYCRVRVLMIASGVVGARRLTWTKNALDKFEYDGNTNLVSSRLD